MRTPQVLQACVDVALRRRPADLLIRGARLFDLATGELTHADLALAGDHIAAVGEGYEGRETLDARGLTAVPGFVDAHCHIESSLLTPYEWERLVLPHGVTAAVCDPHELANVAGRAAIDYFRACAAGMLLRLQVQIPSCVPALPSEEAGARLPAEAIVPYARDAALAEFMNVPGVLGGDPDALAKLAAFSGRPIDGHAPLASGDALNALCAVGIANDHETCSVPEALEKLRRGMTLLIRAGSVAKNLEALAPLLTLTLCDRLCLCTDDRDPLDVRDEGHLDAAIRVAIAQGCDPLAVYRAAGFQRISTPILEDMENLDKSDGGDNLNLIFKVLKRGDKLEKALQSGDEAQLSDMGLRYDLTLPLSRYYADSLLKRAEETLMTRLKKEKVLILEDGRR